MPATMSKRSAPGAQPRWSLTETHPRRARSQQIPFSHPHKSPPRLSQAADYSAPTFPPPEHPMSPFKVAHFAGAFSLRPRSAPLYHQHAFHARIQVSRIDTVFGRRTHTVQSLANTKPLQHDRTNLLAATYSLFGVRCPIGLLCALCLSREGKPSQ